ncbi:MAG: Hpt domain-containing protein [Dinghuibacter sp.]|nr:Hpt domain-containing protein [Dinghuibacter sp.]
MAFIFTSAEIDAEYLNNLYDGDMDLLVSVFEEFVAVLPATIDQLDTDYNKNDPALLKQSLHGCKGAFGYTGFSSISQSMQYLENKLAFISSVSEIQPEFKELMKQVGETGNIIRNELAQLKK